MDIIKVEKLQKFYQVVQKEPGLTGSLKSLVSRKYNEVKAVSDISFNIQEGELVGFIGPNGAGKTTTLKVLSGLLYPTGGFVQVLGFIPWARKPAFQKQISLVMGQKNQLWWDLPPIDTFILNKEIYEIDDDDFKQILDELVKLLQVEEVLKTPTRKLSLGQRMKCELIASLIHKPKVLFLDEPTIGLDVVMQQKMREFIREYNRKYKATIILTSHNMEDVEKLCKRIIIIDKGKIIFDGQLSKIVEKYADHKTLTVILSQETDLRRLAELGDVREIEFPKVVICVKREETPEKAALLLKNFPVADLTIEESSIDDIIREIFTGENVA